MGENIFTRIRWWFQMKPPTLRRLLAVNIGFYLAWALILGHVPVTKAIVEDFLALHPALPGILFMPWQLVSYAFLHLGFGLGGLLHITFNMLWLVWLGQEYEEHYGSNQMAWLYGVGAVGGGLMTVVLHSVLPGVPAFGGFVHGASGAVIAVIAAVVTLQPQKRIALLFLGVWPLRGVLIAFLAFDLLFGLGGDVSVSAHLGGALAGFLFARYGAYITGFGRPGPRPVRRNELRRTPTGSGGILKRMDRWLGGRGQKSAKRNRPQVTDANIVSEIEEGEVDRILDKISEHGYESLTVEEKRLLLEASRE